jgi:hypothetical protein
MLNVTGRTSLVPGIRLIRNSPNPLDHRAWIDLSSGITSDSAEYQSLPYQPGSFVPRPPWRSASDAELAALFNPPGDVDPSNCIQVMEMPGKILDRFAALRNASQDLTTQALREHHNSQECRDAFKYAMRYVATIVSPERRKLDGAGIFFNPPNQPTTTHAHKDDSFLLGLHVDSWRPALIDLRRDSPGRLSINLGLHDRFFLFVNADLMQLARMLDDRGIPFDREDDSTHSLRRTFMAAFPDYPVVRLRIRPGEAYLAPTENVIHDGSSAGQTNLDVHLTVRAHFRVGYEAAPWSAARELVHDARAAETVGAAMGA